MNYFKDVTEPTMGELINWFQIEYPIETSEMKDCSHAPENKNTPNPFHQEDSVWSHTMLVCKVAELDNATKINKISALFHDIGKPDSREEVQNDNGEIRVRFFGHEGLSFYKAVAPLERLHELGVITEEESITILKIISLHGVLFDHVAEDGLMKNPGKLFDKFNPDEPEVFEQFVKQVRYDSLGRFTSQDRIESTHNLGETIFTVEQFQEYFENKRKPETKEDASDAPWVDILIGCPGVGKSTYIQDTNAKKEAVIISRDDTLMEYAKENGIIGKKVKCFNCDENGDVYHNYPERTLLGTCKAPGCVKGYKIVQNYSDVWKELTDEDQKEIDKLLEAKFSKALKNKLNMIIDMTNMSNKRQRKWVNKVGKHYNKRATVFVVDYLEVKRRLNKRKEETGKSIPHKVVNGMMQAFMFPNYSMFNEVRTIW